jgi:hypothetical protein
MAYMKPYVVRPGDYLAKLAFIHGFDAEAVWNHEKNATLKASRDPAILSPCDILYIPAEEDPEEASLPLVCEGTNEYTADVPDVSIELVLKDGEGQPLAGEPFEVVGIADTPKDRSTEGDGTVKFTVPILTEKVTVILTKKNLRYEVRLGHLDPLAKEERSVSGICGRLTNLGYFQWNDSVSLEYADEAIAGALACFQADNGLPETGLADEKTIEKLKSVHGS